MAGSMRLGYETFVISARESSHKYTPQGVKLLSSATPEKAAEAGRISSAFYANVRLLGPGSCCNVSEFPV